MNTQNNLAAVITLNTYSANIAKTLSAACFPCEIYAPKKIAGHKDSAFENISPLLQSLFLAGRPIIGICSSGILIRALAPIISNKLEEPPVIAISTDGSFVIPILGGHRGANKIGKDIALKLQASLVTTTASETLIDTAFDDPPPGWEINHKSKVKEVTNAILNDNPVRLQVESGDCSWIKDQYKWNEDAKLSITLSDKSDACGDVVLVPKTIAIGVGCEREVKSKELINLTEKMIKDNKISPSSIACITSIDLKADEVAIRDLSSHLEVPLIFFDVHQLNEQRLRLINPSDTVFEAVGCYGVAEGAALCAAGSKSSLIAPKQSAKGVTCSIAQSKNSINIEEVGRRIGRLTIVGLGPGQKSWMTPAVLKALNESQHHVGYVGYLELIEHLNIDCLKHSFTIGDETKRASMALNLAAKGEDTALICSGDAGIYGMASLVFELLEQIEDSEWRFVDVVVEPGISAMQAASARAGAPLGHDFCAISLSDLLTPLKIIEKRVSAAIESGFVIALYNPAGKNRRQPLKKALNIIKNNRGPECPVIVARCLGRRNENVKILKLRDLNEDLIDMLTILIIGNHETRNARNAGRSYIYTPRGYQQKNVSSQ